MSFSASAAEAPAAPADALVERLPAANALSLDMRDIDREVFSNRRSSLAAN